jgi:tellurite resistance-related uncharacterized protein
LENKGLKIATKLISTKNTPFFEAEEIPPRLLF